MKALKKPLSLFLAFLMCFGVFAGTGVTAFAAGETMTTYMVDIPRASDPNKAGWGHSDMSFPHEESVENTVVHKLEVDKLHTALAMLAPEEQALIQALFFEEKTERQYAEELGVYRNAIHVRKTRILKKLKKLLES